MLLFSKLNKKYSGYFDPKKIFFQILKINNFRCDVTDILAKKEALDLSEGIIQRAGLVPPRELSSFMIPGRREDMCGMSHSKQLLFLDVSAGSVYLHDLSTGAQRVQFQQRKLHAYWTCCS